MSTLNITAEEIAPAIIQDIAKPQFEGYYQMIFSTKDFVPDQVVLTIKIAEDGQVLLHYPDEADNKDSFIGFITGYLTDYKGEFSKNAAVVLVRRDEEGTIMDSWGWNIENNGHLTPTILSDSEGNKIEAGWTVNQVNEVFTAFVESLHLIQTAAEAANRNNVEGFTLTFNINDTTETMVAKPLKTGGFALNRDDYPDVYLSFKNATYVAEDSFVMVQLGEEEHRWVSVEGLLEPATENPGWALEYSDEEYAALMEQLTMDVEESQKEPDPMNIPITDEQLAFLQKFLSHEGVGAQHLFHIKTSDPDTKESTWFSTRIDKLPSGYIVEVPELIDFLINERDLDAETIVIRQSLLRFEEQKPLFSFHGWKLDKQSQAHILGDKELKKFTRKFS